VQQQEWEQGSERQVEPQQRRGQEGRWLQGEGQRSWQELDEGPLLPTAKVNLPPPNCPPGSRVPTEEPFLYDTLSRVE
jgi:hypothetical protein